MEPKGSAGGQGLVRSRRVGGSAGGGGFVERATGVEGIGDRTSGHGCEKGQQREGPGRSLRICKAEGQPRKGEGLGTPWWKTGVQMGTCLTLLGNCFQRP